MNEVLLEAFKQQDMETILEELSPLFYKYIGGLPESVREDVRQELVLTCIQVTTKYDFSQLHLFL